MQVTKKELAAILDMSVETLSKYIQYGMPGKRGSGQATRYELKESLKWYVDRMVDQAVKAVPKTVGGSDREQSEAELAYWKAERMKYQALREQKVLVTVEEADREVSFRLGQVRDALLTIPQTWSPFVVPVTDLQSAQKVLADQVDHLMQTLSSLPDSESEATAFEDAEPLGLDDPTDLPDDA